jgi:hypothetical protein
MALSSAPFSQEFMNEIFKVSPRDAEKLTTRECSWLEFKLNFNWGSKEDYARTLAAFANTSGGYIVFGISNNPRRINGLSNNNFEKVDPAKISDFLNECFSPEIQWQMHLYEFQNKSLGLIYASKSLNKPVIAARNGDREFREGDIFYRYRGQTKRIRYPELRQILDELRQKEQDYWIRHLQQIAKIGPENAAIFDVESGTVTGSKGSFLIDEEVLPKLKFIKEGEFHEIRGAPALKLIGEIRSVDPKLIQPMKTIIKTKGIRTPDIVHAFLDRRIFSEPEEYIKQICFESSAFLPIYYFMKLANLNKKQTLDLVNNVQSRLAAKAKLIERLETDDDLSLGIPSPNAKNARKKLDYRNQILQKTVVEDLDPEDLKYFLQSIRMIGPNEVDLEYLIPFLKKWFDKYYTGKEAQLADNLRRAICYIDKVQNIKVIKSLY